MIYGSEDRAPSGGKLLGTCDQLSAMSGLPVTPVRIGAVVALLFFFKLTVVAYCLAAVAFRYGRR